MYQVLAHGTRDRESDAALLTQLAAEARARQEIQKGNESWSEDLGDCLYAIADSQPLLVSALTLWLTNADDVPLARAVLKRADVKWHEATHPVDFPLSEVDIELGILVAFRLCCTLSPPPVQLGWILSLVRAYPDNEKLARAAQELLEYLGSELTYAIRDLLSSEESTFRGLQLASAWLAKLDEQLAAIESLPHLREFDMTPAMRLQHVSLRRAEEREIERGARSASILEKIFTPQRVKYSMRVAVPIFIDDAVHETTIEMSGHRLGIELPLSELTDPLLGRLKRQRLWKGPAR